MIKACPTCVGYVFSEIQATVKYYTKDLCLDLELSMKNYARIFLREVSSQ